MLKIKLFTIFLALKTIFCSCNKNDSEQKTHNTHKNVKFKKEAKLDSEINESSGLAHAKAGNYFTHNDGPDQTLFEITIKGKILSKHELEIELHDWEELAEDSTMLFVGDFGNNSNHRNNLRIYLIEKENFTQKGLITFKYEDQKRFPPPKNEMNFDCEAFVKFNDSLYLFSKNRGNKLVKLYTLPAKSGNYIAKAKDSLFLTSMITGADISPDKSKLALLAYGKIYIFELKNGLRLNNPYFCVKFPHCGQVEAILFKTNNELIITNEGGKIFLAHIKNKKSEQ